MMLLIILEGECLIAERRMFAKAIVLSDAFLDMPMSARCLYFTLSMLADDDGFVGSPKAIMRQCGASQDDMAVLLSKRFLLGFESGVVIVKHWRINNYIQKDRYKASVYKEEQKQLYIDGNGAYTDHEKDSAKPMYTECIQNGYNLDTQYSIELDKNRDSLVKESVARARGKYNNVILSEIEFVQFAADHIDYRERIDRLSSYLHNHPSVNYKSHYDKLCEWAKQDG